MSFITEYGPVILFYSLIGLIIYWKRNKFEIEGKIIALYRTKIGIKLMNKLGRKHPRIIKTLGITGVIVGFIGMAFIIMTVIDGLYKLIFVPSAPPTFAPVIPGVKIPGTGFKVPLGYGLIALFLAVVIHEFSHGVVAAAHKIKIKSSGFVMFGPLPGAFVEPDEKQLTKKNKKTQLSVYAAGPFSNILTAIILIIAFGFAPLIMNATGQESPLINKITEKTSIINYGKLWPEMNEAAGIKAEGIMKGSGAEKAGLPPGIIITKANNISIKENATAFLMEIYNTTPGETIILGNEEKEWVIKVGENPENKSKGLIGLERISLITKPSEKTKEKYGTIGYYLLRGLFNQLFWLIMLSLGLGLANLLPLGPVDGGRMYLLALEKFFDKKKAKIIWEKTSKTLIIIILILVFVPIIRGIIGL